MKKRSKSISIWEIARLAARTYTCRFALINKILAVVYVIPFLVYVLLAVVGVKHGIVQLIYFGYEYFVGILATIAVVQITATQFSKKHLPFWHFLRSAADQWWPVLKTLTRIYFNLIALLLLLAIISFICTRAYFGPGSIAASRKAFFWLLPALLIPSSLYLLMRWCFAASIAVLTRTSGWAAMKESAEMWKERRWQIACFTLLTVVPLLPLSALTSWLWESYPTNYVIVLTSNYLYVLFVAFYTVIWTIYYLHVRNSKSTIKQSNLG